jgi:16S rRNA (adenine1518-N6/adenine1519-N6)-dimethyltransferase
MESNPYSSEFIISTLKSRGLWLNKARGQNYLLTREMAERIVSLVPENTPAVFEVGSGLGALTLPLTEKFKTYSLEIDRGVFAALRDLLVSERLTLLNEDFLAFDMASLPEKKLFFVSNLPYSISGEAIRKFVDCGKFDAGVVMLQQEFVDRMTAKPGDANYGVLAILSSLYLETEKAFTAGKNNFFPAPTVDSVIVTLKKKPFDVPQDALNSFLRKAFQMRRKTVLNNLKQLGFTKEILISLNVEPTARPETISPEKWVEMFFSGRKGL